MKPLPLFLIALLLSACASPKPTVSDSMTLYSPPLLHIPAGTEIKTPQGIYRAQVDEVWHSHADYLERVQEALKP